MAILRETEGASAFERGALVKTIRNDFWHQFARALDRGDLSPCSLPPPGGAGMRLFGRAYSSSCGVVLARKKLHLPQDVWCWPAGFFAKTEFSTGRKKSESLDSSSSSFFVADELRRNAVPLEKLERMAIRKEYVHFGETRASTEVAPYNEVLAPVTREAVVAVFARTTRPDHLLLAMAASKAFISTDPTTGLLSHVRLGSLSKRALPFARNALTFFRIASCCSAQLYHTYAPIPTIMHTMFRARTNPSEPWHRTRA